MSKEKILNIMLLLTIAGAMLSFYLYYSEIFNAPIVCPNNGCAVVAESQFSRFLGVHVSLWGLLYYAFFTSILIFKNLKIIQTYFKYLLPIFVISGLAFTVYLRIVELFFIKAICIWCWGSVIIILAIFVLFMIYYKGIDLKSFVKVT